jgi:hypothetical protein
MKAKRPSFMPWKSKSEERTSDDAPHVNIDGQDDMDNLSAAGRKDNFSTR